MMRKIKQWLNKNFHKAATIFWILMIPPSVMWWRNSIAYVVAISIYAIIMAHLIANKSTRVERHLEVDATVDQVAYQKIIDVVDRIEAHAVEEAITTIVTAEVLKDVTEKVAVEVKKKLISRADTLSDTTVQTAKDLKESKEN
jgi:hypothetical protein